MSKAKKKAVKKKPAKAKSPTVYIIYEWWCRSDPERVHIKTDVATIDRAIEVANQKDDGVTDALLDEIEKKERKWAVSGFGREKKFVHWSPLAEVLGIIIRYDYLQKDWKKKQALNTTEEECLFGLALTKEEARKQHALASTCEGDSDWED